MDALILLIGVLIAALVGAVGFKYRVIYLTVISGLLLIVFSFPILNEGITYNQYANESVTYLYGNQTNNYAFNESQNTGGFPFTFLATRTPLTDNSVVCYYQANNTFLNAYIINSLAGTVNVTG